MKKVSLSGSPRENVGKKDAAALRAQGQVPCVIYGGAEQVHFALAEVELNKLVFSPDVYQVELTVGDKKIMGAIKDIAFNPVTDRIMHVDFIELIEGKEVKLVLPVKLTGSAEGVKAGGKLNINFRKVKVSGVPAAFPEAITVDISPLNIGDDIRVRDIELEGVKLLEAASAVVVAVKTSRLAQKAEAEEEAAPAEEEAAPAEA